MIRLKWVKDFFTRTAAQSVYRANDIDFDDEICYNDLDFDDDICYDIDDESTRRDRKSKRQIKTNSRLF